MSKGRIIVLLALLCVLLNGCIPPVAPDVKYCITVSGGPRQCYWTDKYALTKLKTLVIFAPYWKGCGWPSADIKGPFGGETISDNGMISNELYLLLYLADNDRVAVKMMPED